MNYSPMAEKKNMITAGKVRITVLTSRMLRCEWHEKGFFENRETLPVMNRKTPPVKFEVLQENSRLVLFTKDLTLSCSDVNKPFSRETFKFEFRLNGLQKLVRFGEKDNGNLKGTARTLDENRGEKVSVFVRDDGSLDLSKRPVDLGSGFISRNGWALVDDSSGAALEYNKFAGKNWVCDRHKGRRQDIYLLVYGHDYISAVKDASLIFGAQPLPPRYAFGYWYSRYWAYTDKEIEKITDTFDKYKIPLDVFVVDSDWHKAGWTGYTWEDSYFPDYRAFLKDLKRKKLKITLNLHPVGGVRKKEVQYKAMCKAVGRKPDGRTIKFDCLSPKFMKAYFKYLHHPYEKEGVDFWWIDWQQFQKTKIEGLKVLPWLNRLHYEDVAERGQRPLILSRFGGLGSGRYPLGFSGDTHSYWDTLKFQPYFTATAANMLFGYWSHDICGHFAPTGNDPELHLRWIQLGVYSPILRTHTTKSPISDRRIWAYPEPYNDLMLKALERRYELVPYIYTEAKKCYDSGMSIVRPLYYRHPEDASAYTAKEVFYFGSEMLLAPVYSPVEKDSGLAKVTYYLPEGRWVDTARGKIMQGGRSHTVFYLASETPVFVRPGTVIPSQKKTLRLEAGSYKSLVIEVWAGGNGRYELYEDDGLSNDYINGKGVVTALKHEEKGAQRKITLGKPVGAFKGCSLKKDLVVKIMLAAPAKEVKVNGRKLHWSFEQKTGTWSYNGENCALVINVGLVSLKKGVKVTIKHDTSVKLENLDGLKGEYARMDKLGEAAILLSPVHPVYKHETLPIRVMQTHNRISRFPQTARQEILDFKKDTKRMSTVFREFEVALKAAPKRIWFGNALDRRKIVVKVKQTAKAYFG